MTAKRFSAERGKIRCVKAVTLRDGDALVLDDGSLVVVSGRAEPLIEVPAPLT